MKILISSIAFILIASMAFADDLTVKVDDKDVVLKRTSINHEIMPVDKSRGSQNSPMECTFLFYSLLAKGDIQGASKLSLDPAKTLEKWTNYMERIGGNDFRKGIEDYYASNNIVLAELLLGDDTMLLIKSTDAITGQFYKKKDGKYFRSEMSSSDNLIILGKVLTMIQEGKVKL